MSLGLIAAFAGLLGLMIGSFLNVVIHRVPRGESIVSPPSACPRCGHEIRNRHNIPVLGWLILRGRCADCGEPISARYPLVELGTGVLFGVVAWRIAALGGLGGFDTPSPSGSGYSTTEMWHSTTELLPGSGYSTTGGAPWGITFDPGWGALAAYLVFAAIGVALAGIDLDVRRLPNVIVLPAYPVLGLLLLIDHEWHALLRAAEGGAALWAFFFVVWLIAPGGMGYGDVKLSGIVGAMTAYLSWGTLLVGAFGGFLLGAVVGVLLMAAQKAGRKSAVPFGPFMILGAFMAILGAGYLGDYYLSLLG